MECFPNCGRGLRGLQGRNLLGLHAKYVRLCKGPGLKDGTGRREPSVFLEHTGRFLFGTIFACCMIDQKPLHVGLDDGQSSERLHDSGMSW